MDRETMETILKLREDNEILIERLAQTLEQLAIEREKIAAMEAALEGAQE